VSALLAGDRRREWVAPPPAIGYAMRMRTSLVLPALALLLAPGCFIARDTVNVPLVRERVAELVPGQSNAGDATRLLGAPHEVVQLGHRSAYRYDFTTTKRAGFTVIVVTFLNSDTRQDRVWLFFDAKDVLTHVGSSLDAEDADFTMPWEDFDDDA
jgi:hypothetical protein